MGRGTRQRNSGGARKKEAKEKEAEKKAEELKAQEAAKRHFHKKDKGNYVSNYCSFIDNISRIMKLFESFIYIRTCWICIHMVI